MTRVNKSEPKYKVICNMNAAEEEPIKVCQSTINEDERRRMLQLTVAVKRQVKHKKMFTIIVKSRVGK